MTYGGVIYKIYNDITGECYVGQTRQKINKRYSNHVVKLNNNTHHSKKLQTAWNTYGNSAFSFSELVYVLHADYLNDLEKLVISEYNTTYNMTAGGAGASNRNVTPDERKNISARLKSKWGDPVWRAKHIEILKKSHKTDACILYMRSIQALGNRKRWEGHIKKVRPPCDKSALIAAQWQDTEIRARRIAGLKKAASTPEAIAKRRKASTGRVMSKESITKMAQSKWKPVLCDELHISFLCQKYAAEYFNVKHNTIGEAMKHNRKLLKSYSLSRIAT
jgi:group I intron endonuclease